MTIFFRPAVALTNRLRYPHKFLLIALLFMVPLSLVMSLLIRQIDTQVIAANREMSGVSYLQTLRRLYEHALHEQQLSYDVLNGDTNYLTALRGAQSLLDDDIKTLEIVDHGTAALFQTQTQFLALRDAEQAITTRGPSIRSRLSDDLHDRFISEIRNLTTLLISESGLVLDPDKNNYYLIDGALTRLPDVQKSLAQTRLLGKRILVKQDLSTEDNLQIVLLRGTLQSEREGVVSNFDEAMKQSDEIKSLISVRCTAFSTSSLEFLNSFKNTIAITQNHTIQPAAFDALAVKAISASFDCWDVATSLLNIRLSARVNQLERQKNIAFGVTLCIAGVILYLLIGFYRAIMQTVVQLGHATKRMTDGLIVETIPLDNRDELGQIVGSFNEIASALIAANAYQRAILENAIDGILTFDQNGTITTFNPAASRIFGYSAAEMLGQPSTVLFPTPHDQAYRIVGAGREIIGCRKDATTFPLDLAIGEMDTSGHHAYIGIIHDLTERKRAEHERMHLQEKLIHAQAAALTELSTPLIPISDHIVVMPLIGALDSQRVQQVVHVLLQGVERSNAHIAILDITGVPLIDTYVAGALINAAKGVRMLGAQIIITGIRPEVAQTLAGLDIDLRTIVTCSTLQGGIAFATHIGNVN